MHQLSRQRKALKRVVASERKRCAVAGAFAEKYFNCGPKSRARVERAVLGGAS